MGTKCWVISKQCTAVSNSRCSAHAPACNSDKTCVRQEPNTWDAQHLRPLHGHVNKTQLNTSGKKQATTISHTSALEHLLTKPTSKHTEDHQNQISKTTTTTPMILQNSQTLPAPSYNADALQQKSTTNTFLTITLEEMNTS